MAVSIAPPNNIPFDDSIFEDAPLLVALGNPGTGKTTALKKFILDYVEQTRAQTQARYSGIPIFVSLREFARKLDSKEKEYSLLEFILDNARSSLNIVCSKDFFTYYLDGGECLVCFDGLDEVTALGQRQKITNIVETFIHRYPRNRYIVTSRLVGYEQAPLSRRLFRHYIVQPLDDSNIRKYIHSWYMSREKSTEGAQDRAAELINKVMGNERLYELAQNPLLLAIIAIVHKVEAELPHERVKLYDRCSEALLVTLDAVKRLESSDYNKEYYKYRREILEAVAYWMQTELIEKDSREVIVNEADLHLFVAKRLKDDKTFSLSEKDAWQQAEGFLKFIKERSGLLIELGEKQFSFVHLTFQEYFAASYIISEHIYDFNDMWDVVKQYLFYPNWREVILLFLGGLNKFRKFPTMMLNNIMKASVEYEPILRRKLILVTDCFADNIRMEVDLQNEIVNQWVEVIRTPFCPNQRDVALTALKAIRQRPIVKDRLQQIVTDVSESAEARVALATLYVEDKFMPDWIHKILTDIVLDAEVSTSIRSLSLGYILRVSPYFEETRLLVNRLLETGKSGYSVLANVTIGRYQAGIGAKYLRFLREEIRQADVIEFSEADSRFAMVFGIDGWEVAWSCLLKHIEQADFAAEQLKALFVIGRSELPKIKETLPEQFNDRLVKLIADILKNTLEDYGAETVDWLLALDYPIEELFSLILDFDRRVELDNWNIKFVLGLFERLFRKLQNPTPNEWIEKIAKNAHSTLQISFFEALCRHDSWLVQEFASRLSKDNYSSETMWAVIRALGRQRLLTDELKELLVNPLLEQTENHWTKGYAAELLIADSLDNESAAKIMIEVAREQSNDHISRADLARTAANLGEVEEGVKILQELITDITIPEEVRNSAFRALNGVTLNQ